jgi:hypothetical protein
MAAAPHACCQPLSVTDSVTDSRPQATDSQADLNLAPSSISTAGQQFPVVGFLPALAVIAQGLGQVIVTCKAIDSPSSDSAKV